MPEDNLPPQNPKGNESSHLEQKDGFVSKIPESTFNRRRFLENVAIASAVGAVGGLGIYGLNRALENNFFKNAKPAGEQTKPIDQNEANALYAKLYDQIKEAKKQANDKHKNLVILIGEDHQYTPCLINKMMIADIAARLDISEAVYETEIDLEKVEIENKNQINSERRQIKNKWHPPHQDIKEFLAKYDGLPPQEQKDIDLVTATMSMIIGTPPDNGTYIAHMKQLTALKFHLTTGEFLHPRYMGLKTRFSPECENYMINAIKSVHKSRIAIYGSGHIPPLYEALKKDSSVHLMTFDASNYDIPENIPDPESKERQKWLYTIEHAPNSDIIKPVINGIPPSWVEAYEIVMRASLEHRVKTAGIPDKLDKEKADMLRDIMEGIAHDFHYGGEEKVPEGRGK